MLERCTISGFADEISPDFDTQLQVLQKLGLQAVELRSADGINVSKLTPAKARELKQKLDRAGIHVSSVGSPIGKIGIEETFDPHLEDFRRTVETAHILGCQNIRVFSFFIPQGQQAEDFRLPVMERMAALVELAKQEQVVLLHENEKEIYGDTAPRCLELMQAFYGDHFKAVFDFANFVQCGQDTREAYDLLRPYIAYIHVKDAKAGSGLVVPAGEGDGRLREILGLLDQSGYEGYLSLEPHLTDFAGLQSLERNAARRDSQWTGETAFSVAKEALVGLLKGESEA